MSDDLHHQPLRVTAEMTEPVVYYGDGMHLDGPLSYGAYMAMLRAEREALPPITGPWAVDFDLPLSRWAVTTPLTGTEDPRLLDAEGRVWGWRCSAVHADWLGEGRHAVRKMPDVDAMVRWSRDGRVNIAGGQLKACQIAYPERFARRLVWYAVGDLERVRDLLWRVRAVGKLANQGPGRVRRWLVEPWSHDWSIERAGAPTRVMPCGHRPGAPAGMASIRTPYHHRSRQVLAVEPDYSALTPTEEAPCPALT